MRKLYLAVTGQWGDGDISCIAIADDGTVLNQWICASTGYMRGDLHDRHFCPSSGYPMNKHGERIVAHFSGLVGSTYEIVNLGFGTLPDDVLEGNRRLAEATTNAD